MDQGLLSIRNEYSSPYAQEIYSYDNTTTLKPLYGQEQDQNTRFYQMIQDSLRQYAAGPLNHSPNPIADGPFSGFRMGSGQEQEDYFRSSPEKTVPYRHEQDQSRLIKQDSYSAGLSSNRSLGQEKDYSAAKNEVVSDSDTAGLDTSVKSQENGKRARTDKGDNSREAEIPNNDKADASANSVSTRNGSEQSTPSDDNTQNLEKKRDVAGKNTASGNKEKDKQTDAANLIGDAYIGYNRSFFTQDTAGKAAGNSAQGKKFQGVRNQGAEVAKNGGGVGNLSKSGAREDQARTVIVDLRRNLGLSDNKSASNKLQGPNQTMDGTRIQDKLSKDTLGSIKVTNTFGDQKGNQSVQIPRMETGKSGQKIVEQNGEGLIVGKDQENEHELASKKTVLGIKENFADKVEQSEKNGRPVKNRTLQAITNSNNNGTAKTTSLETGKDSNDIQGMKGDKDQTNGGIPENNSVRLSFDEIGTVNNGRANDTSREIGFLRQVREQLSQEIVKQTRIVLKDNNSGEIRLLLKPEKLGNVKIELNLKDNNIVGKIIVDNNNVREFFENNLESLYKSFREGGFDQTTLDVGVAGGKDRQNGAGTKQDGHMSYDDHSVIQDDENSPSGYVTNVYEGSINLIV